MVEQRNSSEKYELKLTEMDDRIDKLTSKFLDFLEAQPELTDKHIKMFNTIRDARKDKVDVLQFLMKYQQKEKELELKSDKPKLPDMSTIKLE